MFFNVACPVRCLRVPQVEQHWSNSCSSLRAHNRECSAWKAEECREKSCSWWWRVCLWWLCACWWHTREHPSSRWTEWWQSLSECSIGTCHRACTCLTARTSDVSRPTSARTVDRIYERQNVIPCVGNITERNSPISMSKFCYRRMNSDTDRFVYCTKLRNTFSYSVSSFLCHCLINLSLNQYNSACAMKIKSTRIVGKLS
jgi:hypothetical protein